MKNLKTYIACLAVALFLPMVVCAAEFTPPDPTTYLPALQQFEKYKKPFDDPRPKLKEYGPKQILPKELYSRISYDITQMKQAWAEVVGFKAPDVVGKIAPEIKPGKYTYKDLQTYPGFKQLMWPDLYTRIKPGGPPFAGSIPEFEIIPTRQLYWGLPIAEATKRNAGKTKLDNKGYIIADSWESGYPFPIPSGNFKAQQIMYNIKKHGFLFESNFRMIARLMGYDKNLSIDHDGSYEVRDIKFSGRTTMVPYGWFDKRAKDRGEDRSYILAMLSPRDSAGMVMASLMYLSSEQNDLMMVYVPSLRRVRQMTSSDAQDAIGGQDLIYDDNEGFLQKLSPTRYPYKYEVLEEREYLVPAPSEDGSEYTTSKGLELRNVKLERRPLYVLKLTQLDSSYVYKYRIFYVDRETFMFYHIENYDQKNRLYRTYNTHPSFYPEMGNFGVIVNVLKDHLDLHSTLTWSHELPAYFNRKDISIENSISQK